MHYILITLLIIDGLICLVSGVLETQFLAGESADCKAFVKTCVPQHHRRLDGGLESLPWLDAYEATPFTRPWQLNDSPNRLLNSGSGSGSGSSSGSVSGSGSGSGSGSHSVSALPAVCGGHPHFGNHDLHDAEKILAYISIGILAFFLIEQVAMMVELRSEYLKPLLILDFFVIVSSLAIEVVVTNMTVGGLLIVARTWRFARVGHGVFESTEHAHEVCEEDETVGTMKAAWAELPVERWSEIRQAKLKAIKEEGLNEQEASISERVGKNLAVTLRCLAYAKGFKEIHDKKKKKALLKGELDKINRELQGQMVGQDNRDKIAL